MNADRVEVWAHLLAQLVHTAPFPGVLLVNNFLVTIHKVASALISKSVARLENFSAAVNKLFIRNRGQMREVG